MLHHLLHLPTLLIVFPRIINYLILCQLLHLKWFDKLLFLHFLPLVFKIKLFRLLLLGILTLCHLIKFFPSQVLNYYPLFLRLFCKPPNHLTLHTLVVFVMFIFYHKSAPNSQINLLNVIFLANHPIKNISYAMILISIKFEFQEMSSFKKIYFFCY